MSLQRGNKIRIRTTTTTTTTTTTHPNQPIIVTKLLQVVESLDLTQLHTIFHHVHVEVNEPWPWSWLFPTSLALGMDFWGNFLREGWRVMWPEYGYFCRFHIYIRYIRLLLFIVRLFEMKFFSSEGGMIPKRKKKTSFEVQSFFKNWSNASFSQCILSLTRVFGWYFEPLHCDYDDDDVVDVVVLVSLLSAKTPNPPKIYVRVVLVESGYPATIFHAMTCFGKSLMKHLFSSINSS